MSIETLDEWDLITRPILEGIGFDAAWIKTYANKLLDRCEALPSRPEFQTKAEAAVDDTIGLLEEIISKLEAARNEYHSKPIK